MSSAQPPIESFLKLQRYIDRWNGEISSGTGRGTLLEGIAGKAVNTFENVLRDCLAYYLDLCGLSYDAELASDFDEKPLHKLTMGEVVQCLDKLDRKFTACIRSILPDHLVANKRLIGKDQKQVLHDITKLRKLLHHHRARFAKDEATLEQNTTQLLRLIEQALSGRIFQIVRNMNGPQELKDT